jgi:Spy/CpxP family protein refolding chaperone
VTTCWLAILGLGLTLTTTATPPRVQLPRAVCTPRGVCITLQEEERTAEGVSVVRMEEKLPRRIAPEGALSLWLAWPLEPERRLQLVFRAADFQVHLETPAGRFELFAPPLTFVRRTPGDSPAVLVHVSFDPAGKGELKAAVNEVVAAAQARGLLTPEQQQVLATRQRSLEVRLPALVRAMESFRAKPTDPKTRDTFLSTLADFPGEEMDLGSPAIAPETFLTASQRTTLRKAGYELMGRRRLEHPGTSELAYRLHLEAYSLEQLVREWNAGLRGPASGIERMPRPALDFDRSRRHEDVSFTLDVRNDGGITRMDQVLRRLLAVPGVRLAPGEPLPPAG